MAAALPNSCMACDSWRLNATMPHGRHVLKHAMLPEPSTGYLDVARHVLKHAKQPEPSTAMQQFPLPPAATRGFAEEGGLMEGMC